ncbi:DUF1614 domain-containing protein [Methylocaldum szegediense]|uniref:Membrane protein n=1 Tax=Methylocaldum szegediense TaxID=73780 RepID=A0ABM9I7V2_9GAMM|nr:DUF1614 domain-containing protein [Methylocaldum szegediense]CAI8947410.1 putative membrane protein [Methylocaldum szegediense]
MRSPFSPIYFLFFLGLLLWIVFSIKLGLITLTFQKLGLNPESALTLLVTSLLGSAINLPLFTLRVSAPPPQLERIGYGLLRRPPVPFTGRTQVAVNVGGCLVPVMFSLYLIKNFGVPSFQIVVATTFVALVSYFMSRPIPGVGIGMPILVAPLSAALAAIFLGGEYRSPLAYIAGSLGVLIGADLLRLKDIRRMAAPIASIGGAGTFDGIFMTGLVAVLLS